MSNPFILIILNSTEKYEYLSLKLMSFMKKMHLKIKCLSSAEWSLCKLIC